MVAHLQARPLGAWQHSCPDCARLHQWARGRWLPTLYQRFWQPGTPLGESIVRKGNTRGGKQGTRGDKTCLHYTLTMAALVARANVPPPRQRLHCLQVCKQHIPTANHERQRLLCVMVRTAITYAYVCSNNTMQWIVLTCTCNTGSNLMPTKSARGTWSASTGGTQASSLQRLLCIGTLCHYVYIRMQQQRPHSAVQRFSVATTSTSPTHLTDCVSTVGFFCERHRCNKCVKVSTKTDSQGTPALPRQYCRHQFRSAIGQCWSGRPYCTPREQPTTCQPWHTRLHQAACPGRCQGLVFLCVQLHLSPGTAVSSGKHRHLLWRCVR